MRHQHAVDDDDLTTRVYIGTVVEVYHLPRLPVARSLRLVVYRKLGLKRSRRDVDGGLCSWLIGREARSQAGRSRTSVYSARGWLLTPQASPKLVTYMVTVPTTDLPARPYTMIVRSRAGQSNVLTS